MWRTWNFAEEVSDVEAGLFCVCLDLRESRLRGEAGVDMTNEIFAVP